MFLVEKKSRVVKLVIFGQIPPQKMGISHPENALFPDLYIFHFPKSNPFPENGHFPPRKFPVSDLGFSHFSVLQVCKFEAHMLKVVLKVRSVEQVHFVDSLSLEGATGSYASL